MKRIVFKVGTSILYENNKLSSRIDEIVKLLSELNEKYEVLLVSSGAVGAGYTKCKLDKTTLENKQALAAIGQPLLMREYKERFNKYGITVAQVLLTAADFDSRKRTQNAQKMINVLLENKQALAAIGQPLLMREYKERFNKYGITVAQVLLTAADFDSRKRTYNAQKMINVLCIFSSFSTIKIYCCNQYLSYSYTIFIKSLFILSH